MCEVGQKVLVNGLQLYYEKVGSGAHVLLLCPGALGTTRTDFSHQLEGFNRDIFTLIAFDPPGYGNSRPFHRAFTNDYFVKDAEYAASMMQVLGYSKYSVLGWSDGANFAACLTIKHPERVRKLVIWGASSFITPQEVEFYKKLVESPIDKENKQAVLPLLKYYTEEEFVKLWTGLFKSLIQRAEQGITDLYSKEVSKIRAPTLIIHGDKDRMVPKLHPQYLHQHIKGSRLVCWPDGKHNLHIRFSERFKQLVEDFLICPASSL